MKKMYLLFLCTSLLLCGCTQSTVSSAEPVNIENPQRVIALSSSIAEMWLLAGGKLAAVTSDAVGERDLGLPDTVEIVGTVKDPSMEIILSREPELVLLSPDISTHKDIAETLKDVSIPYYMAKVETLEDYLAVLSDFAAMTGDKAAYERNGQQVEQDVRRLISDLPDKRESKTALLLRASSGGVKAIADDHTVCYILEDIGVKNIARDASSLLEDLSTEMILALDPDFIFVITMGSSEEDALASLERSLTGHPAWGSLTAVNEGRMLILPKELYHYKPNNRWGTAYEELIQVIYP